MHLVHDNCIALDYATVIKNFKASILGERNNINLSISRYNNLECKKKTRRTVAKERDSALVGKKWSKWPEVCDRVKPREQLEDSCIIKKS